LPVVALHDAKDETRYATRAVVRETDQHKAAATLQKAKGVDKWLLLSLPTMASPCPLCVALRGLASSQGRASRALWLRGGPSPSSEGGGYPPGVLSEPLPHYPGVASESGPRDPRGVRLAPPMGARGSARMRPCLGGDAVHGYIPGAQCEPLPPTCSNISSSFSLSLSSPDRAAEDSGTLRGVLPCLQS